MIYFNMMFLVGNARLIVKIEFISVQTSTNRDLSLLSFF